ncbi:tetratricopeptide repeat protein [Neobacillus mesonae]|uniref:Peptidase C39-like domain-containing protein n=1 Tax=Neobacillus mesonae TaxID=1193713 RepID=A0A3T0HTW0_9BACI|nr:tetratricopeptide repeat protein [Neobacillus mesonae]AZU60564.1 hypothetical protein CHR53_04385 [Neobacillus mesonae]
MITNTFIDLLEKHHYQDVMELFTKEFQKFIEPHTLSSIKNLMNLPEETMKDVLKVMDLGLMSQWSRILIRNSYSRRKSPSTAITIWFCEELINENKLIEAEELLRQLEREELSPELSEKLYFNLAVALIHMQRFGEGYVYMKKCENAAKESMNTRWAYYYLNKGEWDTALQFLEQGKRDRKDGALSYALLVQHHIEQGELVKAKSYLEEGLHKHPHYPKLLLEKIRLHYTQRQWNKMRESIAQLADISPHHDYQYMCDYYEAESYYAEEQLDLLQLHLDSHPELTNHTHFKHFNGSKNKPLVNIHYKPVVQKYNFCVPAVVQMSMSAFSHECGQEEIASSIFDVAGSKISKAIDYFEANGFVCRLFLGNEEKFKRLVDHNAAVMITIDYPSSSHVQLLTGYDDNLQVFHIQDPNFREPHQLEYQNVNKELGNNFALSVAIIPAAEASQLHFLNTNEHETYKRLLLLTEECSSPLAPEDLKFLTDLAEDPLVAIYSVKYLASILEDDLLEKLIKVMEQNVIDSHYRNLIIAMAFKMAKKDERASLYLEKVEGKKDSTYYYLKGLLSYDKGEYLAASEEFKKGIKREPDDYILWSYLALAAGYQGQNRDALRLSQIALDINDRDIFPLLNHGMILYDNEQYEEARSFFTSTLKMKKDKAHIWYERARCDMQLNRYHQAERGFKVAIGLDPDVPLPYRELANLYEFAYEQRELAESVLKQGLVQTSETYLLLLELGEFYERDKDYDSARTYYSKAAEKDPKEPDAFISLGALLKDEGKIGEFFSFMTSLYDQFKEHDEFLINSGKLMWESAIESEMDTVYLEQALSYMEQGIRRTTDLEVALEWYTSLIEDTPFYRRGIEFLEEERAHRDDEFLLVCYIGCLYEQNGYLNKAKSYQQHALTMKVDILPLYRLGEIHAKSEEYEKAKGFYQKVLTLDPAHGQAMLDLASIASLEENTIDELHYLMEAFTLDPYSVSIEAILSLMDAPSMVEDFWEKVKKLDRKKYDQAFLDDSIAYIYGKLGNLNKEQEYLTKALEHSPESPQLLHHQVKLLLKKGERKKAKKECLQAIQKYFDSRDWFETLIEIYSKTKSINQLSADLKKLELKNEEKSIIFMNSAAAYEKVVAALLEERDRNEQKGFLKRITSLTKASFHLGIAINLYESAMKLDPENSMAAAWFSDFYLQMSISEDAIKVLEQALQSHWNPDLAYKLASLYVNERDEMSQKKQAEYLFKAQSLMETLVEEQNEPEFLNLLGLILFLQERLEEAKAVYIKYLDMEPDADRGYLYLGKVYAGLEDYPNAEIALRKALELLPEDPEVLNELGITYRLQQRLDEALECIEYALELYPDDLYLKYNRAAFLSLLGRLEEAARQLEEVFDLDEETIFLEMAEDDPDFLPLEQAGLFPQRRLPVK